MTNIQQELDKINKDWGKIDESSIQTGRVRRIKIFKDGSHFTDCVGHAQVTELIECPRDTVKAVLKGKVRGWKDYYFVYADQWKGETQCNREYKYIGRPKGYKKSGTKKLLVFSGNNLVGEYRTVKEAADKLDLDYRSIYNTINNKKGQKTHRGYNFKYVI